MDFSPQGRVRLWGWPRPPPGRPSCVVHPIAFACLPLDTKDMTLACIWGAALGMSRAARFAHVDPTAADLFCSALDDDPRYVDACYRSLLSWTGVMENEDYTTIATWDHPLLYAADFLDGPILT